MVKAGSGPVSDGIPEPIGKGGESDREMPAPPRASVPVDRTDRVEHTVRMRKPWKKTN